MHTNLTKEIIAGHGGTHPDSQRQGERSAVPGPSWTSQATGLKIEKQTNKETKQNKKPTLEEEEENGGGGGKQK